MDIDDLRKIAKEEMTKAVMDNINSALIFSYVKGLEEKLDKKDKIINAMAEVIEECRQNDCLESNEVDLSEIAGTEKIIEYFTKNV